MALVIAVALLSRQAVAPLSLGDYGSYRCDTRAGNGPIFRVLTLTTASAVQLADQLCRAPTIGEYFGGVEVSWRPRGYLTAKQLVDEQFDLFWNREHIVYGLLPAAHDFYAPLLKSATYPLYWVSLVSEPRLDAAWFASKRVGFLQDSHSQSFYQQPSQALKEAGIELAEGQKLFYPSIDSLHQALLLGEVDVISSAERVMATLNVDYHRLLLNPGVHAGYWFLRNRWLGTGIDCDLLALAGTGFHFGKSADRRLSAACVAQ